MLHYWLLKGYNVKNDHQVEVELVMQLVNGAKNDGQIINQTVHYWSILSPKVHLGDFSVNHSLFQTLLVKC